MTRIGKHDQRRIAAAVRDFERRRPQANVPTKQPIDGRTPIGVIAYAQGKIQAGKTGKARLAVGDTTSMAKSGDGNDTFEVWNPGGEIENNTRMLIDWCRWRADPEVEPHWVVVTTWGLAAPPTGSSDGFAYLEGDDLSLSGFTTDPASAEMDVVLNDNLDLTDVGAFERQFVTGGKHLITISASIYGNTSQHGWVHIWPELNTGSGFTSPLGDTFLSCHAPPISPYPSGSFKALNSCSATGAFEVITNDLIRFRYRKHPAIGLITVTDFRLTLNRVG